jgi:Ca2+-binding RTX toxin-like protein
MSAVCYLKMTHRAAPRVMLLVAMIIGTTSSSLSYLSFAPLALADDEEEDSSFDVPGSCRLESFAVTITTNDEGDPISDEDDVITGTEGPDVINGLGSNDIICGGSGDDEIDGGLDRGNIFGDYLVGDDGDNKIEGGDDELNGGDDSVSDVLFGDVIDGGSGDDTLIGGDDKMVGGAGESGSFGDDIIDFIGDNTIRGGDDELDGSGPTGRFVCGDETDNFLVDDGITGGTTAANTITGGDDKLYG